jgi:uncharacterized protein YndB with AHSA1/START domain
MSVVSEAPKKSRSLFVRVLKWVGLVVLAVVVAVVVIGLFILDGKFELARETTINAPPEAVYKQVGDLREWPNWLPFTKHDKSVNTTIEQPTGVGAYQHWTSDHGNGKLKFTKADEATGVAYDMTFDEKWPSKGEFVFAKAGDGTRVTWKMSGQYTDFMGKWMAVFMPKMVGGMFEEGLADLKAKVEGK